MPKCAKRAERLQINVFIFGRPYCILYNRRLTYLPRKIREKGTFLRRLVYITQLSLILYLLQALYSIHTGGPEVGQCHKNKSTKCFNFYKFCSFSIKRVCHKNFRHSLCLYLFIPWWILTNRLKYFKIRFDFAKIIEF